MITETTIADEIQDLGQQIFEYKAVIKGMKNELNRKIDRWVELQELAQTADLFEEIFDKPEESQ